MRKIAAQVARGGTRTQQDEFVAEALSELFVCRAKSPPRIASYDPTRGSLEPWLAGTLKNVWLSRLRAASSEPDNSFVSLDPTRTADHSPAILPWHHAADLLDILFNAADEDRIASWPPRERVELMCMSGLFVKLTETVWGQYLRDYESCTSIPLARPFPPAAVLAAENPADRTRPLAAALGLKSNTLSVRWMRAHQRLGELDVIRELRDAAGQGEQS
ncbi:hypothetical protein FRUB_05022 [Fimbriiglobus ruber]|uniref:Uncharacterized protein n=1 Tax=Fimbriiglobus ruber TaxID=1908690 RepID=A0A225DI41_9BACT|nr:hypothetical protein FRUB_05022 [Fimbriiglobus ruber]